MEILEFLKPENLQTYIESFGAFAPLVFIGICFVCTLLLLPVTPFSILSGLLFGPFWGLLYMLVAITASGQVAFTLSHVYGDRLFRFLSENKAFGPLVRKIDTSCRERGFVNMFLIRCLNLPYGLVNYAAGTIKHLKARNFFFATLLSNIIFVGAFVYFGDAVFRGPKMLLLPLGLIVLVVLIPTFVKKYKLSKKNKK